MVNISFLRFRIVPLLALGSLLGLMPGNAFGQLDSLLANSPFGSAKSGAQSADATGSQPFEFRGVSEENGQQFFSILDTTTKHSRWLVLNATNDDLVIKSYDADTHTVSLDQHGRLFSLTLKSGPRVVQNTPPPMMNPGINNGQPAQFQANGAGKGPDAQRLQQIADEIRRRRALRAQGPQMPVPNPSSAPGPGGPVPMPGPNTGGPTFVPGQGNGGPNFVPGVGPGPMPTPSANSIPNLPQKP